MSEKVEKNFANIKNISAIRFLILDVDGVMTDGSIVYGLNGEEMKFFDVKDGAGLKYWARAGHAAGIITGRSSPVVERRAAELGIIFVEMDAKNKLPVFEAMLTAAGVTAAETAVIGDDLPDIPLIRRAGLGIAVADAVAEAREAAVYVTTKPGGKGAVREVVEGILKVQNRWDDLLRRYYA